MNGLISIACPLNVFFRHRAADMQIRPRLVSDTGLSKVGCDASRQFVMIESVMIECRLEFGLPTYSSSSNLKVYLVIGYAML